MFARPIVTCLFGLVTQNPRAELIGAHQSMNQAPRSLTRAPGVILSNSSFRLFPAIQGSPLNGSSCPIAVICPTSSEYAARPLEAVAIGDCHGQELNRRNLHDPALSPAQVEPRPRGLAVARRQTKGLENGIPDWKSVSLVRRARKYPRAPHAGLPRRSHASRYQPHTNGISLPAHVEPGERARCGRRRSSETPDRTP
jgi:hypothetical protein